MKLQNDFYLRADVVQVAQDLLGKLLITKLNGVYTSGIITETEAYAGITDKASHAYGNRRTQRTLTLYKTGGVAYVYLCYGIHHLFNVVTHVENTPHAVLIRSVEPVDGVSNMQKRRKMTRLNQLTTGPGKLSQALGITTRLDGKSLLKDSIWIEDNGYKVKPGTIKSATRIGVDYAGSDALLPYRFYIQDSKFVSVYSL
ncbi:MAG: DNA-3-methyladenine glycosylase [Bacteroidota bacterium]|jgi:DNA-3-methyladenine glycosylase